VRQVYLDRAKHTPSRIRVIDGQATIDNIRKSLQQIIASL